MPTTVRDLIAMLQELPPTMQVLRADSEYGPQDIRCPQIEKIAVTSEFDSPVGVNYQARHIRIMERYIEDYHTQEPIEVLVLQ